MKPQASIVQSVFDFAIREINALEDRIVQAEDDADAMLWEQAAQVVAQLDQGLSQVKLAAQWINTRNEGKPYSRRHVQIVKEVFTCYLNSTPRPRFRDAYNEIANAAKAHVSQNSGEQEWYTPRDYIEAARRVMGGIDLDPATTTEANQVVKAAQIFTRDDDSLTARWDGRIWLNPPYAYPLIEHFCDKLAEEVRASHVIAACVLVNNATETNWFQTLGQLASMVCFPLGRIRFWSPTKENASPLQGQAILYIGPDTEAFDAAFAKFGVIGEVFKET